MAKIISTGLFVLFAGVVTWIVWRFAIPRMFETPARIEQLAMARDALDGTMPLNPADHMTTEVAFNHGGQVGIGRRYSSSEAIAETLLKFSTLKPSSADTVGPIVHIGQHSLAHCFNDLQLGLEPLPGNVGYFAYAVQDKTAVHPLGCGLKNDLKKK